MIRNLLRFTYGYLFALIRWCNVHVRSWAPIILLTRGLLLVCLLLQWLERTLWTLVTRSLTRIIRVDSDGFDLLMERHGDDLTFGGERANCLMGRYLCRYRTHISRRYTSGVVKICLRDLHRISSLAVVSGIFDQLLLYGLWELVCVGLIEAHVPCKQAWSVEIAQLLG